MRGLVDPQLYDRARLAALSEYEILDTPPEADFDDIVQLAAQLCDTPISLVSLLETDRQWFKARVGLEQDETPIDQSVCRLGLGSSEMLIIPDLTADPRTARNSLVDVADGVRFYAGAPLIAPKGEVLGMLCVIDREPRPQGLTAAQQGMLATLARQVIAQLELRRAMLRRMEEDIERRQLNELLSERLNQTLAMINGLASQTLRAVPSRGPVESFQSRLNALTEAHELLQRKKWTETDMRTVVANSLARHATPERFTVTGPAVQLAPKGAISTAMLLHELGSNAVKYGALSVPGGSIAVEWNLSGEGDDALLSLGWAEAGGPPAVTPTQRSFGAKLIAMGLGGGGAVRESYGPEGYRGWFEAPLVHLQRE